MKIVSLALVFAIILGTFLTAEAGRKPETVKLQVNKEKVFPKSKLKVKFLSVEDDSRCPVDTNCIWAGNAKIKLRVSKNGRTKIVELNSNLQDKAAIVEGYSIKFVHLTPEPRSNIRIDRNGYVATFEVVKLSR
jgi:hypothetical protein